MSRLYNRAPLISGLLAFSLIGGLHGQTTYSISLPCGQTACLGYVMNDVGAIAGSLTALGSSLFAAYPEVGTVLIDTSGIVNGINNAGIVVGTGSAGEAFAYLPGNNELLSLDPVFGWTSGAADAINDEGQIVGTGSTPAHFDLFPALNVSQLAQINNSGQILGSYLDSANATHAFLYTPGQEILTLPGLTGYYLNNAGQAIYTAPAGDSFCAACQTVSYVLYTPGGFSVNFGLEGPAGINDSGQVILNPFADRGGSPTLWTNGIETVLQSQIPANSGWTLLSAHAINNRGQILVWAFNFSVVSGYPSNLSGYTSLILTPEPDAGAAASTIAQPSSRIKAASLNCRNLKLNSRVLCQGEAGFSNNPR